MIKCLPLFNGQLFDESIMCLCHTGGGVTGSADKAVDSIADIVHSSLKTSNEKRKKKNEVTYAEARNFVLKRLPEPLQTEISNSSGQMSATVWQKHVVPTIVALMPGFFIGTVRAHWGIQMVLSCFHIDNRSPVSDYLIFPRSAEIFRNSENKSWIG